MVQFLALLAEYGNVTRAAEESHCSRVYLYTLKRTDPDFAKLWEEAAKVGAARLEDEARRRAIEGYEEPTFYQGQECGRIRKYSDTLLICLLRAHHPEKYRDNVRQEISGPEGTPVRHDVDVTLAVRKAMEDFEKEF